MPAETQPINDFTAQWAEVRRRRWRFQHGFLLAIPLLAIVGGAGSIATSNRVSQLTSGILFFCMAVLTLGFIVSMWILLLRFMWWPCPRCGHRYFGWWHIRDVHWSKIWSCVHCGLLVDSPNANSCPDRRDVRN